MAEHQITVGQTTYPLPSLFLVMATQNPIEQEGTYPLPEAQLDRFLMYVRVNYPSSEAEAAILALARRQAEVQTTTRPQTNSNKIRQQSIFSARKQVLELFLSPELERYMIELVIATREPQRYHEDLVRWIRFGASPRATIALDRCARAHAWLKGRDYVSPEDIHAIAHDVLRHRILLTFEAEAEGITPDGCIDQLLALVPIP